MSDARGAIGPSVALQPTASVAVKPVPAQASAKACEAQANLIACQRR
ncbi:hypothetical protein SDC9_26376 [bioreactor metagenome]|uniref:Uncharacterized protein n=1 Tax=bioreactor metagenome TaxID=1076179 RepID=A0A644UN30_9ZZZZ